MQKEQKIVASSLFTHPRDAAFTGTHPERGRVQVSGGESRVSRGVELPNPSHAPRSKPKLASSTFGGLLQTPGVSP
jgi:hypothetical protein